MKRVDVSNSTAEQASEELALMELKKMIQKARRKSKEADESLQKVHKALEDMCIELNVPTNAENADDLEQAVNCYIQYGEYNLCSLMKEIRKQYCSN